MRIKPLDSKVIVVLLGNFNPRIFLPSWFAKNGVIGEEEGENAEIKIVHREVVQFQTSWLSVLVDQRRFVAESYQPPVVRLKDFMLKTFVELLAHTPVWAMGINKRIEFDAGSIEQRDQIGEVLAPPDAWGEWAAEIRKKRGKMRGGMVSLSMCQAVVDDRPEGYIQARVEPSKRNESVVSVEVNDHYVTAKEDDVEGCREIMKLLEQHFEKSIERAERIIDQVMGIAHNEP